MADRRTPTLDGLIQSKGAPRPEVLLQRGEAAPASPSPARTLQTSLTTAIAAPQPFTAEKEPRSKSLTLRLSEPQYERLRRFAFERRLSHQDILERAMIEFLDRQERCT